jgi:hypothetical protein
MRQRARLQSQNLQFFKVHKTASKIPFAGYSQHVLFWAAPSKAAKKLFKTNNLASIRGAV